MFQKLETVCVLDSVARFSKISTGCLSVNFEGLHIKVVFAKNKHGLAYLAFGQMENMEKII